MRRNACALNNLSWFCIFFYLLLIWWPCSTWHQLNKRHIGCWTCVFICGLRIKTLNTARLIKYVNFNQSNYIFNQSIGQQKSIRRLFLIFFSCYLIKLKSIYTHERQGIWETYLNNKHIRIVCENSSHSN